jgi:hypothetical protein
MTAIHIRPDPDCITVDDLIRLESGDTNMAFIVSLLSRMARDEYGVPLPPAEAETLIRGLTLTQLRQHMGALTEALDVTAVPKASASG